MTSDSKNEILKYLEKMKSEIKKNGFQGQEEKLLRFYISLYQLQLIDEMNNKRKEK